MILCMAALICRIEVGAALCQGTSKCHRCRLAKQGTSRVILYKDCSLGKEHGVAHRKCHCLSMAARMACRLSCSVKSST